MSAVVTKFAVWSVALGSAAALKRGSAWRPDGAPMLKRLKYIGAPSPTWFTESMTEPDISAVASGVPDDLLRDEQEDAAVVSRTPPIEMTLKSLDEPRAMSFDELLDAPLIDPLSPSSSKLLAQFKTLMREDYDVAETIWVAVFCTLMVYVGMFIVSAYVWMLDEFPTVQSCAVVKCAESASSLYDAPFF